MNEMKRITALSPAGLKALRREITLNSIYTSDYETGFHISPKAVQDFFDGYVDFLFEMAEEEGFFESHDKDDVFAVFDKYDNADNLLAWQDAVACGLEDEPEEPNWCEAKVAELEAKPRGEWTEEDSEAYDYAKGTLESIEAERRYLNGEE